MSYKTLIQRTKPLLIVTTHYRPQVGHGDGSDSTNDRGTGRRGYMSAGNCMMLLMMMTKEEEEKDIVGVVA